MKIDPNLLASMELACFLPDGHPQRLEVQNQVNAAPESVRQIWRALCNEQQALRQAMCDVSIPEHLVPRLLEEPRNLHTPRISRRWLLALGGVLLIGGGVGGWRFLRDRMLRRQLRSLSDQNAEWSKLAHSELFAGADRDAALQQLKKKSLSFDPRIPEAGSEAKLLASGVLDSGKAHMAYTRWQFTGYEGVLLQFNPSEVDLPREFPTVKNYIPRPGKTTYHVVCWFDGSANCGWMYISEGGACKLPFFK